ARRRYAGRRQHRQHRHQSRPDAAHALRSARRPRAGRSDRHGAAVPGRQQQPAGGHARGLHPLRQAHPDAVSYAAAGVGTTPDLAAHEFNRRAGLKLVLVPFRGTAPAVAAVLGGDVQVTFVSMGPHIEFVRQGKLRILAAATPQRVSYLPDVPTFAEQGFPGFETSTWFALFAPRGTPGGIVEQLNGYVRGVGEDPEMRKRLEGNFIDPASMTTAEFAALVTADAAKWQSIVRETGARVE